MGVTYLVGNVKFKLLFHGPLAEKGKVTNLFTCFFRKTQEAAQNAGRYGVGVTEQVGSLNLSWPTQLEKVWFLFFVGQKNPPNGGFFGKRISEVGQGFCYTPEV